MKTAKKPVKPYWEMNTDELAAATREFDDELCPDDFGPLGPEKQAIWERLQGNPWTLRRLEDVQALREEVTEAGVKLTKNLKKISSHNPLEALRDFKFRALGFAPYDARCEMNLVEQINQSATLLVACAAVESLLRKHPSPEGYVVSQPTAKGYDVWAEDVSVVAEVFAATYPGSNRKIKKDLIAVLKNKAPFTRDPPQHRYVFFVSQSLKGLPPTLSGPVKDPVLGDVWHLVEHGRCSVTVVRLPENAVFCTSEVPHSRRLPKDRTVP